MLTGLLTGLLADAATGTELPVGPPPPGPNPGPPRWSDGGVIPFGEAEAAAMAPALVRVNAMAATAAVRLPLHRGLSAGAATAAGAPEAYGASCGTLSWISDRDG